MTRNLNNIKKMISYLLLNLFLFPLTIIPLLSQQPITGKIQRTHFLITYDSKGITSLSNPQDPYGAQFVSSGQRFGQIILRYKIGDGDWLDLYTGETHLDAEPDNGTLIYTDYVPGMPMKMVKTFKTDGTVLDWTIDIETMMEFPVLIGDLAIALPWRRPFGENLDAIFEKGFTKHHFISGHGSFLYFVRPSGEPPFLVVTVHPGTKLEYYNSEAGRYLAYIYSGLTGGNEKRGTWRQEHTFLSLTPASTPNSKASYGFRFRWANSYDDIRKILFEEGLFDIRVVPGMTVPEDLSVQFSLHTKAHIESIQPEFPAQTRISYIGEKKPGHHLYHVEFKQLGENKLTIVHDGGRQTILEFFVTEPLETLIKKRSSFIVNHQQHRDPSRWYNGLFSVYDMKNKVLRSPDNTDGFDHWWGYVLACDDPALCKAPYVASKNVHFPVKEEIEAVEYYLENFVWGKLQRSDQETPYPYGIHGVPNWLVSRDLLKRAGIRNRDLDKMGIWRSYDYPHMVMLYFHMYEIAKKYPGMTKYLDDAGYLERAYQTARAYFIYPYEILPWYETYKWGCYNELVILNLIDALEKEGFPEKAAWLRGEWEKKVKYFVYDDKYPYRSEYALDRTAFESSYALAKYGTTHEMKPDHNLWWDKKLKKWYSHPAVKKEDSRRFMDRQLAANLACRGWLETAYYLLGADFTASSDSGAMSYMAKMGGWAILDYGVNFAPLPYDWLQLGYASYLSSWSLMNTGQPETNYGFWFPGKENDGASGWTFKTEKFGRAWIRKDVPRGPWHYDGEIDLGYGAGLRIAATVLTHDPLFGWFAYGGTLSLNKNIISVIPRDGLRKRFYAVVEEWWHENNKSDTLSGPLRKFKMELDRDGFAPGAAIVVNMSLDEIQFTLENRTGDEHNAELRLSFPEKTSYAVFQDGKKLELRETGNWDYPFQADLIVTPKSSKIRIIKEKMASNIN